MIVGENNGTIKNCYSSGYVNVQKDSSEDTFARAGGISAQNKGVISNCYANATLSADAYGKFNHTRGESGGIVAVNLKNASIENCLVFGVIEKGNNRRGDVAAWNEGTITNCYKDQKFNILDGATDTFVTEMTRQALSNPTFYRVTLKWDSTIWNYQSISLDDGIFPTLIFPK